jgi:hypothetical protein
MSNYNVLAVERWAFGMENVRFHSALMYFRLRENLMISDLIAP